MAISKKQREYIDNANHRWNFKTGATRAGKTYIDFAFVIPKRIRERIGKDGLAVILGVTKSTIERNVLEPIFFIRRHVIERLRLEYLKVKCSSFFLFTGR